MACSSCSSSPCNCGPVSTVNLNTAAQVNICTRRGDTFVLEVNVSDKDGQRIDLTNYTFKMEVREYDNGPLVIADPDIDLVGTDQGVLTITIAAADMLVDAGTYVYGVQATLVADSTVSTWLYGTFEVIQDIVEN
jgi:hypothetical protein